jgi:hypothetical protein
MSAHNNPTTDEAAIRDLIENGAKAVRTKNLNGIPANYSMKGSECAERINK